MVTNKKKTQIFLSVEGKFSKNKYIQNNNNKCYIVFMCFIGRYSPVRRASEGSKSYSHGPLHEYQLLQRGINNRNFLITPNQPLDNSISLPGKFLFCIFI